MGPTATRPVRGWAMAGARRVLEASRIPAILEMSMDGLLHSVDDGTIAYFINFVKS
jgi:hypothetical protein